MFIEAMKDYVSGYIMRKIIIVVRFDPKIVMLFLRDEICMHIITRCVVLVLCLYVLHRLKPYKLSSFTKWLIITFMLKRLTSLKEISIIKLGKSKLEQSTRENIWEVVFTKINIVTFPIIVNGAQIVEN